MNQARSDLTHAAHDFNKIKRLQATTNRILLLPISKTICLSP